MCSLTIDRRLYEPQNAGPRHSCDDLAAARKSARWKTRLASSDRLRLDVAIADVQEMYSWAGANRFDDRDLDRLVNFGASTTGEFSGFLRAIFGVVDPSSFLHAGNAYLNGTLASQFRFRVPVEKSMYQFRGGGVRVTTGYGGTFLVDPKSADLIRLVISTDELPPETGSCGVTQTLDYGRIHLNDADFLFPTQTLVQLTNRDGSETDSHTAYANCHEFRGESQLKLEPLLDAAPARPRTLPVPVNTLPPGLPFKVALTRSIKAETAAAGDVLTATLTTDIRDKSSRILVPAGTAVRARIVKMLYRYTKPPSLTVSIQLESIDNGGMIRPIWAVAAPFTPRSFQRKGYLVLQTEPGLMDIPDDDGVSALTFRNVKPGYVVPAGLESIWRTLGP